MTGFIPNDDDLRVAIIHRNQWSSVLGNTSYKTYGASFDMRNCILRENRKHFNRKRSKFKTATWGFGLSFLHDESGTLSVKDIDTNVQYPLQREQIMGLVSLHKPLNDRTFLNFGLRVGGIFQSIKSNHLTFDEQFDGIAGFDSNASGEFFDINTLNNNMLDFGTALSFSHLERKWGIMAGGSIDHILIPAAYNFIEKTRNFDLSRKYLAHAKVSFTINKNSKKPLGINLKGLFFHQNSLQQIIGGINFFYQDSYQNYKNFTLTFGANIRSSRSINGRNIDAIIAALTLNFAHYSFGFNYDINASKLQNVSNAYGGLEFSMLYRWKKKKSRCRPTIVGCPDENTVHAIFF